jgi:Circadian oscillating protein COP23
MTTLKSTTGLMGLFLIVGSSFVLPSTLVTASAQTSIKTTFACVKKGEDPATIAVRGDRKTSPMIIWKDKSYGIYTPQKRCEIVSKRLTRAVASSGTLKNLNMTHGMLNSLPVICYITSKDEKCTSTNILFSLKSSERGREKEIVAGLLDFSKFGTAGALTRGPKPETLGDAIEQELKASDPVDGGGQE